MSPVVECGMVAIAVPTVPATIAVATLAAIAVDSRDAKMRWTTALKVSVPRPTICSSPSRAVLSILNAGHIRVKRRKNARLRAVSALPTSSLGRTGLEVAKLGYGAMELRGPDDGRARIVTPAEADELLNAVLDAGINYIDTSPDYGVSEEHIGRAISQRRGEFFLASKCGCPVEP